jgi:uncharacterized repeat protein (TIGR01451 family)
MRSHGRRFGIFILLLMLVWQISALLQTNAQTPSGFDKSKIKHTRPTGTVSGKAPLADTLHNGTARVIIELTEPAALTAVARVGGLKVPQAASILSAQVSRVQASQSAAIGVLSSNNVGFNQVKTFSKAMNAIVATVNTSSLDTIRKLPGVKQVYLDAVRSPDLTQSVPFIGAPPVWASGLTGQGINIAIIDTGVDYTHVDFGGNAGTTWGGAAGAAGTKIKKGGNLSNMAGGDPMPCLVGAAPGAFPPHGTHVASIAAGFGELGGATYTGPWDTTTPFSTMNIGPGVAPQANIFAYNVFGCSAGAFDSDIVTAIEQAITDGANVINMSLGSDYGEGTSPSAIASNNAAAAGVVVAIASGNSGDTYFVTGDPGGATSAITVAAATDASKKTVVTVNGTDYTAVQAGWTTLGAPIPGTIVISNPVNGCTALTNAAAIAGNIALIQRGGCTFQTKVDDALAAGAIAMIVDDNGNGVTTMGGTSTLPSVMISQADGITIRALTPVPGIIQIKGLTTGDVLATFSSRGPRSGNILKPDVTAPGVGIVAASAGSVTGSISLQGTSMATPHIAGTAALFVQAHPGWTPAQIKALIMNTAIHDLSSTDPPSGPIYTVASVGGGREDVSQASVDSVIAFSQSNPDQVSVSFGLLEAVNPITQSQNITVQNLGNTSATYTVSFTDTVTEPGVSYAVSPPSITVPANGTATVNVTITAQPETASQPHTHDALIQETQGGFPRHWIAEAGGYVVLTAGGTTLRVPVYAVPRGATAMSATAFPTFPTPNTGTTAINLAGQSLQTGVNIPYDEQGIVTPFDLTYKTTESGNSHFYVGITSDLAAHAGDLTKTEMFFGIATHARWSSPNGVIVQVLLDTKLSGTPNIGLMNYNVAQALGATDPSDTPISVLFDPGSGALLTIEDFVNYLTANAADTYLMNTNLMVLPAFPPDLGLTAGNSKFNYQVQVFDFSSGALLESSPVLTYDPVQSPYDFTGGFTGMPYEFDVPGPNIPLNYNLTVLNGATPPDILLFHHHNAGDPSRPQDLTPVLTTTPPPGSGGSAGFDPQLIKVGALQAGSVGLPGDTVTWTLTLTNQGSIAGNNIVITDPVSPDLRVDRADTESGTATVNGQTVTFTIPTLNPGQTIHMHIYSTIVHSDPSGIITNTADLSGKDASGTVVTRTANAQVRIINKLPSTGFPPPPADPLPGVLAVVIGLLLVAGIAALWLRHRTA